MNFADDAFALTERQTLARGQAVAQTLGATGFTITRTNMRTTTILEASGTIMATVTAIAIASDGDLLPEIRELLGRMIELQADLQILSRKSVFSRTEVISLTSLLWRSRMEC